MGFFSKFGNSVIAVASLPVTAIGTGFYQAGTAIRDSFAQGSTIGAIADGMTGFVRGTINSVTGTVDAVVDIVTKDTSAFNAITSNVKTQIDTARVNNYVENLYYNDKAKTDERIEEIFSKRSAQDPEFMKNKIESDPMLFAELKEKIENQAVNTSSKLAEPNVDLNALEEPNVETKGQEVETSSKLEEPNVETKEPKSFVGKLNDERAKSSSQGLSM